MIKISVIIPTYNRKEVLLRAIESVRMQKIDPTLFECIVIDDASTDGTAETLENYWQEHKCDPFHYKYFRLPQNRGVSYARNRGVGLARGEWVAFLDSDDEWLPHKLQWQWEHLQQNPLLRWIHGEEMWIRNGVRVNPMKKHQKFGGRIFSKCIPLCVVSPSAVMLQKSLYIEQGGFREDFIVCEDYDLWLKISAFHEIGFIEKPIIKKYGGHEDQLSHRYKAMDYYRVLSLASVLERVEGEERDLVRQVLKEKINILITGYEKHENKGKEWEQMLLLRDRTLSE